MGVSMNSVCKNFSCFTTALHDYSFPVHLGSCLILTLDGGTDTPLPDGISECETEGSKVGGLSGPLRAGRVPCHFFRFFSKE